MSESQNIELLASYWTIAVGAEPHTDHEFSTADFKDRVVAASRAGFKGIGIWHADLANVLKKYTLPEMKRILDDHGIRHVELEFLFDWFLDGERKQKSEVTKRMMMTAAEGLGARHIKVGDFFREECPMPRLIERFAGLCREAEQHGTRIVFELMPFAMIDTLEGALDMIAGAGAKNGGILLDTWHMAKLGVSNEQIARIPPQFLLGVELDDGTYKAPWDLHTDTINHRLLCGQGEFDVRGFIRAVQAAGYSGPFGIEVLNKEMRSWPLERRVTESFDTTMSQFT